VKKAKATVYRSPKDGLFYVRVKAANGEGLFRSGDGYARRIDAQRVCRYFDPSKVEIPSR
jgi:uncharacterized protein YegP (UPF0339 family)